MQSGEPRTGTPPPKIGAPPRSKSEGSGPPHPPGEEPERLAWKAAAALAAVVAGLVVWRACTPSSPPADPAATPPDASASAAAAQAQAAPRCAPASKEPFVLGAEDTQGRAADPASSEGAEPDQLAPFAVQVGRGAAFDGGFAAGALRHAEGGAVAMIATLGPDGTGGKLIRLARSRGDLEPPAVTGAGPAILAAMLEPNAGGRAIRIAKIEGDQVSWGAELAEGRDESLALDLAASQGRAVIVWDDVTRDGKRSRIMMASIDTASLRSATSPRPISAPKVDAEVPRVIARPGGFWLAYVARSEEGAAKDVDEDTASAGEAIGHQWIEVIPLDETGSPAAGARAVTPKDGHVLAFDMALGEDGAAMLAFRDDDTPSGSSGGRVSVQLVGLGQVGAPRVVAGEARAEPNGADEGVGSGVPALLPGWIAVAHVSGATRLAALDGRGEILDALATEDALGRGEPIAANGAGLLVARPAGIAMKLSVLRCSPGAPGGGAAQKIAPAEAAGGGAGELPGLHEAPADGE